MPIVILNLRRWRSSLKGPPVVLKVGAQLQADDLAKALGLKSSDYVIRDRSSKRAAIIGFADLAAICATHAADGNWEEDLVESEKRLGQRVVELYIEPARSKEAPGSPDSAFDFPSVCI